jgi:Outer membrane protein beta-barrel domain
MKKIIYIILMTATVNISKAQHFQLGVKAGANVSNFTGGDFDAVKKKALIGIHAGAYLRFKFSKLALQPEVIISTQGAKIDSISGSYDWKITYVNVPVMLQYYFNGGFYVEAGPQVGFATNQNFGSSTIEDFANDLDLAAAIGLGLRGKSGLGIGARYTAGLSKVGDFTPSSGVNPDFKNSVLQFSVYIPLTAGKK